MQEYVDEVIILAKKPSGEADTEVVVFGRHHGKFSARAKSARKITSKLSAHLEPGNLTILRFVEKNGFNVTDALKQKRLGLSPNDLTMLEELLPAGELEEELWNLLANGRFSWQSGLAVLGWDPQGATCQQCGRAPVEYFSLRGQEFFCGACVRASKIPLKEVLCITNG